MKLEAHSPTKTLDPARFEAALAATVAKCRVLDRNDAVHFVEHGYVVVKAAFSKKLAQTIAETAWTELEEHHGLNRGDPRSWERLPTNTHRRGRIRTRGTGRRFRLASDAPTAAMSQADLVGGRHRLLDGESLSWGDGVIANFGSPGIPWRPPDARQPAWHKDGWHFRHFLNSPEQALVSVPIYCDILPKSGGTFIAVDSIAPVARLLARFPEGLHPDGLQGWGYLVPGLIEQCTRFKELTGEAGDLVLLHPYMLHRASVNASTRPRFIANFAPVLNEAMRFSRPGHTGYSLVELAVLWALDRDSIEFTATREPEAVVPRRVRENGERALQEQRLRKEMSDMARRGFLTPAWGTEAAYESNRIASV
ncbi:MAG: phytanoyl-CoA dioxygenase family protein [Gammaproteobacteria bacterium]|nr:phytanoyl-CoA dioxygenase family protein [Gammaproteobacteria bacterium]